MDGIDIMVLMEYVANIGVIDDAIMEMEERRRRRLQVIAILLRRRMRRRAPYCVRGVTDRGPIWEILRGDEFQTRRHLRVTPHALRLLVLRTERKRHGWSRELEVIMFLFWLACGTSYRVISTTFGIPLTSVSSAVRKMLQVMVGMLRDTIRLPHGDELNAIGRGFAARGGSRVFSKCVGAIDGSHVRVFCPSGQNEQYINRKLFYSVQFQLLVDSSGKILDFFTGFPGSVHDARVLRHSSLYVNAMYPPQGYFIIGDGGYPCRVTPICLMTPFRAAANPLELLFNTHLSKARIVVEQAIGMMKTRWRSIFTKVIELNVEKAVKVIAACAALHNICVLAGDIFQVELRENGIVHPPQHQNDVEAAGDDFRLQLAMQLQNELNVA